MAPAAARLCDHALADPTTGDPSEAKTVSDDEISAAIGVVEKDASASLFRCMHARFAWRG